MPPWAEIRVTSHALTRWRERTGRAADTVWDVEDAVRRSAPAAWTDLRRAGVYLHGADEARVSACRRVLFVLIPGGEPGTWKVLSAVPSLDRRGYRRVRA